MIRDYAAEALQWRALAIKFRERDEWGAEESAEACEIAARACDELSFIGYRPVGPRAHARYVLDRILRAPSSPETNR